MKKDAAIKIITDCAKQYHANLEGRNLLFVFGSSQKPSTLETVFLPRNFLHLTGVEVDENSFTGSSDFYEKCLKGQLSPSDFSLANNGTTEMKLSILPQLMNIHRFAKMVGDYSFTKSMLYTEKLAGNITACLGFVRDDTYYIPNTAIKEDIREVTRRPQQRVLLIYKKLIHEAQYSELCYVAKGIDVEQITKSIFAQAVRPNDTLSEGAKTEAVNTTEQRPSVLRQLRELQEKKQSVPSQRTEHKHSKDDLER